MKAWENSAESQNLSEETNNYSTRHYKTSTGLETWFTLPNLKTLGQPPPPPRWKMAIKMKKNQKKLIMMKIKVS